MISYKYNEAGVRTEKTLNGVTTKYYLSGYNVIKESNGTDTIWYTYDTENHLISMSLNGNEYYYVRNFQNDIIGILDQSGTEVVTYTYDAWGKLINVGGSLSETVGQQNPYRYRSYRYDTETGLYYLQSRYYDPEWGRFINGDSIIGANRDMLAYNLYAYCSNNPVNNADYTGEFLLIIGGVAMGTIELLAIGCVIIGASIIINPEANRLVGKAIWNAITAVNNSLRNAWYWSSSKAKAIATNVANSFAASKSISTRNIGKREWHHLVAQRAPNAENARMILRRVKIGYDSLANKEYIKYGLHRRLHTNLYYGFTNSIVISAYKKGNTEQSKKINVYAALSSIRLFVRSLDKVAPY